MKKFAIVYFLSDSTCEVVRTSDVQDFNEDDWRANRTQEWVVIWRIDKETTEECPGEVKAISDDRRSLIERRDRIINGGDASTPLFGRGQKRKAQRALAMDAESSSQGTSKKAQKDSPCRLNSAARAVGSQQARVSTVSSPKTTLERVRERRAQDQSSEGADEIKELQQQVKELKGQVQRLEAVTSRMEHLETITRRLEALLEAPSNSNVCTVERTTLPLDDTYTDKMPKALVRKCNKVTEQKLVNDLMDGMYSRQYMAMHTTSGPGRSDPGKRPLRKEDMMGIIGVVQHFFRHASVAAVKACIRQKLNNAVKAASRTPSKESSQENETGYSSNRDDDSNRDDNSDRDDISDNTDNED